MRFQGQQFDGKGITVAVVDSGIDVNDPRLAGATIEGWSLSLGATGHAVISPDFHDEHGHGTQIAAAVHRVAPAARILAIKIMGSELRASAELMAAGIETASKHGAEVVNLSLGTPNMGKALLLRDCCGNAVEAGTVVLAAAHPRGERAYPADLPETLGVASHPDCPEGKTFFFAPKRFPRKVWPSHSGKYLAHGYDYADGPEGRYRGSGLATAHLSGTVACLRQALPAMTANEFIQRLQQRALVPVQKIGYA